MFRAQRVVLALGITATLGLAAPAATRAGEPFSGAGEGIILDVQNGTYQFAVEGLGEPLGHFGGEGAFILSSGGGLYGKVKLFNADQDTVYAAFIAQRQDDGSYTGTLTIVGGEGRFAEASGSADWQFELVDDSSFSFRFDGTITY
jgi:hypothetical protein